MKVDLVSITKSDDLTAEELIVHIARVSNPENQSNKETAPNLIRYLIKNKHWSPFEMVDFTVRIETSRAIAQQILRHRSFSFQEFSQRYSEVSKVEPIELRKQAEKNRQSSTDTIDSGELIDIVNESIRKSQGAYSLLLKAGVAKECARFVLPLSSQTTLYMKGSLRSWIHYLQLRTSEHTQKEHREIALAIEDIFREEFPVIYEAIFE